nr:ribonuclease H-like domain-containing protein [Tanacetum cinerariifolium]
STGKAVEGEGNNVETVIPPTTAEEKLQRRNEVNAASSLNIDNLSDAVICDFLASDPNSTHLVNEDLEQVHPDDLKEMDPKCECRAPRGQDNRSQDVIRKIVPVETLNFSALVSCDWLGGYDWSDQAEKGPTNYALMAYSTSSASSLDSEFHHHTGLFPPSKSDLSYTGFEELFNEPKTKKSKDKSNEIESESVRKHSDAPIIEDLVLDDEKEEVEKKEVKPSINRINFVKAATYNNPRETVKTGEQPKQKTHRKRGNQRNWNGMMSHRLGSNWEMFNKSCYECGSFEHLIRNCQHHQNKIKQQKVLKPVWNNSERVNHKNYSNAKRNLVRQAAPTLNAAIPINDVHPKRTMNAAKKLNTAKPKAAVNAANAKAKHNAIKGKMGNVVKASACWVWKPKHNVLDLVSRHSSASITLKKFDYVDAGGTSKHMTGNMSFLIDNKEIDRGYVAFGGNPKGGKITGKENLMNLRVKVIRCDNGTEFKNMEMNQFHEVKGIMRQYNVAKTPQQNRVVERRNKTLIEAARTMLADLKMPTTFWAEAVNTACYVQNKVLVTKPHNKTPYEFFHGKTPAISFLRPFGCPVTIFNTIDHLGKFDGKDDEGFFVGYSLNSKAFRVFNSRTKIVEENLHVSAKKVNEDLRIENECNDQGKEDSTNRVNTVTSNINAASSSRVNVVGSNISIDLSPNLNVHSLEDIGIFEDSHDDEDVFGVEADFHNLDSIFQVSPIPTTRIHKDHPLKQVIGDLHSAPQTRRISKNLEEHGLVGTVILRTKNKDLQNYLFSCFVSQLEPKKVFRCEKSKHTNGDFKPLLKDEDGEEVDVHMYRLMIGSLMYLTSSRPAIMFVVCACARYQVTPKVSHLHVVNRIFRYLKGQPKLGLWYPKDSPFDLVAYTDSDYAGTIVANFIIEAEYVAASSCCGQELGIQNQLLDYGVNADIDVVKVSAVKVESLAIKETVVDKEESSKQGRKTADIDADAEVNLENVYSLYMAHEETVLSMQDVDVQSERIDADVKEVDE